MSEMLATPEGQSPPFVRRLSLRRRLVCLIALASLLLTAVLGVGLAYFVYQTELSGWQSRQQVSALYAANAVSKYLQHIEGLLQVVGEIDRDYLEQNSGSLEEILAKESGLSEAILLDPSAGLIANTYRDAPVLSGQAAGSQPGWLLKAQAGKTYAGLVQVSEQERPYLILAIPVKEGSVAAARLPVSVLWEEISDLHFGKTGSFYIIDRDGHMITHPDLGVIPSNALIDERPEIQSFLAQPDPLWSGTYENFQGIQVLGTAVPIPGSRWIFLGETSQSEVYGFSRLAVLLLAGGMLLIGALVALSTDFFLSRLVFIPIRRLQQGTKRFEEGNLDERIPELQPDEIGQATAAFNEMAERLQDRVTALTQARDKALEASQFKSRLLANVSHDLRTPLSGILGYADMLHKGALGPLSERQQTAAERIVANTGRLRSMINSLLDQAQMEAGTFKLRAVTFSPTTLVNEVRMMIEVLAQSKCLALTTEIDPDLPETLIGDPQRLQQILVNLAVNAIKFTSQGSVSIFLFRFDAGHWAIQVSDTGRGIPPDAQQLIFEPFQQVDNPSTCYQNGVGLGLSIVQQLAALMDGHIQLSSQVGQGSIFTVILPLQVERLDEKIVLYPY